MATTTHEIWVSNEEGKRKLEGAELSAFLEQQAKDQLEAEKLQSQIKAKADAKAALLERLGITADEAALLLG
jgi:hypothetical protein